MSFSIIAFFKAVEYFVVLFVVGIAFFVPIVYQNYYKIWNPKSENHNRNHQKQEKLTDKKDRHRTERHERNFRERRNQPAYKHAMAYDVQSGYNHDMDRRPKKNTSRHYIAMTSLHLNHGRRDIAS